MDGDGILPDAFETLCRRPGAKALYCMPTVHNPTTVTMPTSRRQDIVDIARRFSVPIIEDDAYGFFADEPVPPISAMAPDISWYLFTVAKSLSVQLRLSLLVGPSRSDVQQVFAPTRRMTYWMATPLSAEILNRLIRSGAAQQLLEGVKQESAARQRLAKELLGDYSYSSTRQSPHLWLQLPEWWERHAFQEAARAMGVLINVSDPYAVDPVPASEALRICIGAPAREVVKDGLERLAEVLSTGGANRQRTALQG
jgi:DNA-binding transcriptional MocR family regulator